MPKNMINDTFLRSYKIKKEFVLKKLTIDSLQDIFLDDNVCDGTTKRIVDMKILMLDFESIEAY